MIELFVKKPVTTIMFVLVFVVLGFVSYFNLSIENTPKIDFPMVNVKTVFPGATPEEVEQQVNKKIEDAIAEISGIKKIHARSYENFGYVLIEFNLGNDVNVKSIEVKDKVEAILNKLPDSAEKPIIEKFDPMVKPIIEMVLSSDKVDARELYEYADKKLKTKLTAINGVAKVDIYGGRERQINVKLDPNLMKQKYISISDVIKEIRQKNMNVPGGSIDKKNQSFNVRFVGEFATIEEIKNTKLVSGDGNEFTLNDIATIEDSYKKIETAARFNGLDAVGLSIKKVSDGNSVDIGLGVKKVLPKIQETLPEGMKLEIASDDTNFIIEETDSTIESIIVGILLTIIVLYLFTSNVRLTFIASIVIPTSIISAFFTMDFSKFTINMMTLLAIGTSLGTLIANAIVIIESILVHIEEHGKDPVRASIDGTKEVFIAVLASTGTNLVVFAPIAFMGGIVGQFMKQFGLTVIYATMFSLIASFSLTPMMCALMLKAKEKIKGTLESGIKANGNLNIAKKKFSNPITVIMDKLVAFLLKEYKVLFDLSFKFPKTTIILSIALFVYMMSVVKHVGNEFIPTYDRDKILINVTTPQGSTIEKTLSVAKEIEEHVKSIPEMTNYLTSIGGDGLEQAQIIVNLKKSTARKKSDLQIINELIPVLSTIPDAEIELVRGESEGGGTGDVTINVKGIDYDRMIEDSKRIVKIMEESGYFRSVISSYKNPKKEVRFIPDQNKLTLYDLPNVSIASTLRSSVYGDDSNVYKENGEEYKLNIELADYFKTSADDLKEISVISHKGLLPITSFGSLEEGEARPTIWRRDRERIIQINGYLSKSTAGQVSKELENEFKKIDFPKGHGYVFSGNAEMNDESQREIGKAFLLASILTYMILAAIMNSFIYPFVIATTIFTSMGGVFMMLFFMGHSINIASMLAIVMLVGIVVNNAILVLDYTLQKLAEGKDIIESLWLGMATKFRAVLMTSIAIIAGTWPQMWSVMQSKASMGSVIIGGMFASIIFTFIMIPVVFWYFERMRRFSMSLFKKVGDA